MRKPAKRTAEAQGRLKRVVSKQQARVLATLLSRAFHQAKTNLDWDSPKLKQLGNDTDGFEDIAADYIATARQQSKSMNEALAAVKAERNRQDAKWGVQNHAPHIWLVILGEEFGEASKATLEMDWNAYRAEMVQVAAVAVAAIEACDRELGVPPNAALSDSAVNRT